MSLIPSKSKAEILYQEACKLISNANPIQSDWDFVSYDSYAGQINTPFLEVGGGASIGTLTVQRKGGQSPNKFRCLTGDLGAGISPMPVNVGFPLPTAPSTGIIFKLSGPTESEISVNSFRAGFFSFTQAAGCGPTGGLTYMLFLPKMLPNMNLFSPGILWTAGVMIITAGISGSLPDVGVTCSLGCAI